VYPVDAAAVAPAQASVVAVNARVVSCFAARSFGKCYLMRWFSFQAEVKVVRNLVVPRTSTTAERSASGGAPGSIIAPE
jgi:hypothetical protein